jgi:hypothetical protein
MHVISSASRVDPAFKAPVPTFRLQKTQRALGAKELKKVSLDFVPYRISNLINRAVAVEAARPFCRVGNQTVQSQNETSGLCILKALNSANAVLCYAVGILMHAIR